MLDWAPARRAERCRAQRLDLVETMTRAYGFIPVQHRSRWIVGAAMVFVDASHSVPSNDHLVDPVMSAWNRHDKWEECRAACSPAKLSLPPDRRWTSLLEALNRA